MPTKLDDVHHVRGAAVKSKEANVVPYALYAVAGDDVAPYAQTSGQRRGASDHPSQARRRRARTGRRYASFDLTADARPVMTSSSFSGIQSAGRPAFWRSSRSK